jgi:hypothetical protein
VKLAKAVFATARKAGFLVFGILGKGRMAVFKVY